MALKYKNHLQNLQCNRKIFIINISVCIESIILIYRQLDEKFEMAAVKYYQDTNIFKKRPIHINLKIESDMDPNDFEEVIISLYYLK